MCWSWHVSLSSWALCLIFAAILYRRNHPSDRYIATYVAVFGQIQLLEFFMWLDINRSSRFFVNEIATSLAFIVLVFQPIALNYFAPLAKFHFISASSLRKFSYFYIPGVIAQIVRAAVLPYLYPLKFAPLFASLGSCQTASASCPFFAPHLHWSFNARAAEGVIPTSFGSAFALFSTIVFFIGMFVPLSLLKPSKVGIPCVLWASVTLILAWGLMFDVAQSMWCWFAVFCPLMVILINRRPPPTPVDSQSELVDQDLE